MNNETERMRPSPLHPALASDKHRTTEGMASWLLNVIGRVFGYSRRMRAD